MDYSCSFSEFDCTKRVKKAIKNENLEKHFSEETKNNKEKKLTKNKSVSSFKELAQSFFKQKNIEMLNERSECSEWFTAVRAKPKKKHSCFLAENYSKRITNANTACERRSISMKSNNASIAYEYKNENNNKNCEQTSNERDSQHNLNNTKNNCDLNIKHLTKDVFESLNSLNYKNKGYEYPIFNNNYKNNHSENYKIKKTNIKKNTNDENSNKLFLGNIKKTYINLNNEKTKIELKTNLLLNETAENQKKNKKEEQIIYSEAAEESAKIERLLIIKILKSRSDAVNKIIKNYKINKALQLLKEKKLISEIIKTRKSAAIHIQSAFRSFFTRKYVKVILCKLEQNYIFIYDYNKKYFQNSKRNKDSSISRKPLEYEEEPNHDIKLQLLGSNSSGKKVKSSELLGFEYSNVLKCYMLVFRKKGLIRQNYKVNFIVNGHIVIDPRFKLDADEDGKFYNIIESHMLLIRNKIKNYENKLRFMVLQSRSDSSSNSSGIKQNSEVCSSTKFSSSLNNTHDTNAFYSSEHHNKSEKNIILFTEKKTNFENKDNNKICLNNNQDINAYIYNNNNNNKNNVNFSLQESKYWEDIFKIKVLNQNSSLNTNSVSDASESQGDVDKIFTVIKSSVESQTPHLKSSVEIKPCLKKQNWSKEGFEMPTKKSVSFDDNVQIFFFSI